MRRLETILAAIIALLLGFYLYAAPQKRGTPLTEVELTRLLVMGVSNKAISDLVHKYGISFQPDGRIIERLKKLGAQKPLLEAIRRAAPAPKLAPKEFATPPPPHSDPAILEASRHLTVGEVRAHARDFEGALREFAEAERIRPQWAEVSFQRSLALAALEHYSEAAAEGKKYIAAVRSGTEVRGFSGAIAEWEARGENNDKANRLVEQGKQELGNSNLEAAIKSFQEAVLLNHSVSNLLNLDGAYLVRCDYESLSKTAEAGLKLDPRSAPALLYKSAAELGQGDPNAAIATVHEGLGINPNMAFGYALLGLILQQKRDLKGRLLERVRPVQVDASSGWAHDRLGWALWNGGRYQEALRELQKAAAVEPANAAWYSDLSYALHFRGEEVGALSAARQALRSDSSFPSAHDAMGLALETRGSLDEADREYREAVRLSPPDLPEFVQHLNAIKLKKANSREERNPTAGLR